MCLAVYRVGDIPRQNKRVPEHCGRVHIEHPGVPDAPPHEVLARLQIRVAHALRREEEIEGSCHRH